MLSISYKRDGHMTEVNIQKYFLLANVFYLQISNKNTFTLDPSVDVKPVTMETLAYLIASTVQDPIYCSPGIL